MTKFNAVKEFIVSEAAKMKIELSDAQATIFAKAVFREYVEIPMHPADEDPEAYYADNGVW